ncbi:MAG: LysR family transcriptional regulator [Rhodanobacter sp.]|jgi:DNA-binding transcriptional LysR family regulator|nr:LysR family transcriptional regulator [Rhodanobacter sp.]
MTFTQLRYLVAIADAGLNITLAAERVHATQPGLSKLLRQLEDELGFQLFHRKGRSLHAITHAGTQVLERARTILAEAENIRSTAANLRNESHGTLRIATTHTQARFVLPGAIAALNRSYPQVSVHLQPVGDADVISLLDGGQVDLAIVSTTSDMSPPNGIALPAYRWNRIVLVPRQHPLARQKQPVTLERLAMHPLISYDSSLKPESSLGRAFQAAGLQPQIAMTASDADLIKTYVREGLGIGVLAEMAFQPELDTDLRRLDIDHLFAPCTAWIVLRRESVLREYMLDFIGVFAPHLERRMVSRVLAANDAAPPWSDAPHWRERQALHKAAER